MTTQNRVFFLDNLRAFVVLCVVGLHGAMVYMDYPPPWWYVTDPQHSLFFTAVSILVDIPIMMVLFFVAAYFTLPSLLRRDTKTFLKEKFIRIGAPWIVGVLLLTPPTEYIAYYSRHVPMGFGEFWATDFWGARYQQSVYWFLGILSLFFVLSALARSWLLRIPRRVSQPSWKMLAGFWGLTTLAVVLLGLLHVSEVWFTGWYVFVFQPWRVPLYLGYFILGIIAWLNGWFTTEGYKPRLIPWSVLWILAGALYLETRFACTRFAIIKIFHGLIHNDILGQSPAILHAYQAVLFNTFCLSSVMAGAAFFQRYVNGTGRVWQSLAATSYGVYYVHPLIIYPLALGFVGLTLPLYLKAPMVTGLAFFLSWAASAFVLRKAPGLRRAF